VIDVSEGRSPSAVFNTLKFKFHLMDIATRLAFLFLTAVPVTLLLLGGKSPKPAVAAVEQIKRGEYLVQLGGCSDCHTPKKMGGRGPEDDLTRFLAGHPQDENLPPPPYLPPGPWSATTAGLTAWSGPWGISYASNLTPDTNTGLGIWTEEMFIRAMRTGKHYGASRDILPPMPWQNLSKLTGEDLKAIFAYLRSIPPVRNQVSEPLPPGGKPAFE
jgi:hypothetical protein